MIAIISSRIIIKNKEYVYLDEDDEREGEGKRKRGKNTFTG